MKVLEKKRKSALNNLRKIADKKMSTTASNTEMGCGCHTMTICAKCYRTKNCVKCHHTRN